MQPQCRLCSLIIIILVGHQKRSKMHHPQMIFAQISTTQHDTFNRKLFTLKTDHPKMIFSEISTTQHVASIHNVVDYQHNQIRSNMHAPDLSACTDFHTPFGWEVRMETFVPNVVRKDPKTKFDSTLHLQKAWRGAGLEGGLKGAWRGLDLKGAWRG